MVVSTKFSEVKEEAMKCGHDIWFFLYCIFYLQNYIISYYLLSPKIIRLPLQYCGIYFSWQTERKGAKAANIRWQRGICTAAATAASLSAADSRLGILPPPQPPTAFVLIITRRSALAPHRGGAAQKTQDYARAPRPFAYAYMRFRNFRHTTRINYINPGEWERHAAYFHFAHSQSASKREKERVCVPHDPNHTFRVLTEVVLALADAKFQVYPCLIFRNLLQTVMYSLTLMSTKALA
jgi:hypothetical protein